MATPVLTSDVLTADEAVRLARSVRTEWEKNHRDVLRFEKYRYTKHRGPKLPEGATDEYRGLQERSLTPWADRIVTAVSDQLYVDGFLKGDTADADTEAWDMWQRNGLDATQTVVYDDVIAYGKSYVLVMPGDPVPQVTPWGIRNTLAVYEHPGDEYPLFAFHREPVRGRDGKELVAWTLVDDRAAYKFEPVRGKWTWRNPEVVEHGAGRCPVVAFWNRRDAYGNFWGEIELVERLINRLDQDTFDRLVTQRFSAWKVRTATGMLDPELDETLTEEQKAAAVEAQRLMLLQSDILTNESPDAHFGTLDETPLDGFLAAFAQDVETLGAMADIPPSYLLGKMIEMSAEALAAAEAGLARKVMKRQASFGESWEQVVRLAAHIERDTVRADDFGVQVKWRQLEPRFLAQAADGLGKLRQMLGVPSSILLERMPGWTQQDVARAVQAMAEESDEEFLSLLRRNLDPFDDAA